MTKEDLAVMESHIIGVKGLLFDLPEEQRNNILARKAAGMLAVGPGPEGIIAMLLALGELCKMEAKS